MISNGRTYRNSLNLGNQDKGQDTHSPFLLHFSCFLKKDKDAVQSHGIVTLTNHKVANVEKFLFILLSSLQKRSL